MSPHKNTPGKRRNLRRMLRAQWRDAIVLLNESGSALLLFFALVVGGSLLFYFFYIDPTSGQKIAYSEALYGTFALVFFQDALEFPHQWYLQALYFIIPILGLIVVADGVIRFGGALTNKKERGQKWQIAMASTYTNHIIVCGLGKIGYRVILELLKYDRDFVAIEINPNGRFVEKAKALGIPVILADGGIRSGGDILKMIALGADAVLIGRPFSVAAIGGLKEGVITYIASLKEELQQAMVLTGCRDVSQADSSILRIPGT